MAATVLNYLVLLTANEAARKAAWRDGYGRLFLPFNGEEEGCDFAILQVSEGNNAPNGQPGYYLVETTRPRDADLLLMDPQGDSTGLKLPEQPVTASLDAALALVPEPKKH